MPFDDVANHLDCGVELIGGVLEAGAVAAAASPDELVDLLRVDHVRVAAGKFQALEKVERWLPGDRLVGEAVQASPGQSCQAGTPTSRPDVSLLAPDVENREQILRHVASQPGSLRVCGDRLPDLIEDPWALDMTRHVLAGEIIT